MIYKSLPKVGLGWSHLPHLEVVPTRASSSRYGAPIRKVWLHRWGVKYTNQNGEALSYHGVIRQFQNPDNEASSHLVYPGSAVPDECTQMVPYARKSWTESAFNRTGVSVETADAIWLLHDPKGFAQLARIVAWLLHHFRLPAVSTPAPGPVVNPRRGFCRHADGGSLAGGHTQCPTTDLELWGQFVSRVKQETVFGGFRPVWGA